MCTRILCFVIAGVMVFSTTGCSNSPACEVNQEVQVHSKVIPGGSSLSVWLNEPVSTLENQPEDSFSATLAAPVIVDGQSFFPAGTQVKGVVREVISADPFRMNQSLLTVSLSEIFSEEGRFPIQTTSRTTTSGGKLRANSQDSTGIIIPAKTLLTFRLRSPVTIH